MMMGWAECPQFKVPIRRCRLLLSRLYAASLYRSRTSSELASLAGKLMHHKDKEVRSLAAIALANRRK